MAASSGEFEFPAVPPGTYEIRVLGAGGRLIHQEVASVDGSRVLSITLPETSSVRGSGEATVSARQLQHRVPAAARKAYDKGRAAAARGYWSEAAKHLERAVTIDPDFADAHSDLGGTYLSQGDLEKATAECRRAVELVPDHRLALLNLSITLMRLRRYGEAGEAARRVLKIDPGQARAHLILAGSLVTQAGRVEEILNHLDHAAPEIPTAHILAAELLAREGRRGEAVGHLESYLRAASPVDRERAKAQQLLAQLSR